MSARYPHPRLAKLLEGLRSRLLALLRRHVPPELTVLEMVTAAWLSQALCVAAKLGIPDALAAGPASAAELARRLQLNEDALFRLLRALSQHGVFTQGKDGRFGATALSRMLRADSARSLRSFALYVGSPEHRAHWSSLEHSIASGGPSIEALRRQKFFDYLESTPAFGALFHDAMTGLSILAADAVLSRYDFSHCKRIVDVGGGEGHWLLSVLARAPAARGVIFDLPAVRAAAERILQRHTLAERCTFESGSFFEAVPGGADTYLLKHILHDLGDTAALTVLRNVRAAIGAQGRLLLFESTLGEGTEQELSKLTDLEMLLSLGGRERTERELTYLLRAAGFGVTRVIATVAPTSIIEARAC